MLKNARPLLRRKKVGGSSPSRCIQGAEMGLKSPQYSYLPQL